MKTKDRLGPDDFLRLVKDWQDDEMVKALGEMHGPVFCSRERFPDTCRGLTDQWPHIHPPAEWCHNCHRNQARMKLLDSLLNWYTP